VVIEKPFGRDLASSIALNRSIHEYFDESQVYRIDHYLGKETVQNLLVFRFANAVFESIWNRDRIESVQITVAEDLGVEHRGRYYEGAGALRDMVQNHLTQLLTLIAMEIPSAFDAEAIRVEKLKVLRSLAPIRTEDVVFGQYGPGTIGGAAVPAYRTEPDVAPDSSTETYVALRLEIANWRWYGVPFFLRTGKRLPRRATEIAVRFRCPPVSIFRDLPPHAVASNVLVITIQPDEGFALGFQVKAPGQPLEIVSEFLHFRYGETFQRLPEAYETLLLDVMLGDQTLFVWSEVAETAWRIYAPLIETRPPLYPYAAGTWGPAEADRLVAPVGHDWLVA
jgi:glucose-6-phosphate 1-dehydrogenase